MATSPKTPAPPSFYSNMAGMGSSGAGAKSPDGKDGGGAAKKPAGEEEVEIVKTLFRVFEKWRKAAGSDKEKSDLIQQMVDTLQKYNDKFVKSDGSSGPSKEGVQPSAMEGNGPAPSASMGAGGMETQPVPA